MPPTPTIAESPPRPSHPLNHRAIAIAVAVAAASAFVLVQMSSALEPSSSVDRITVHNDTAYDLNVKLRGSADGSVLSLGQAPADSAKVFHSVADPGATFVFEFSYAGVDAGSIAVDRTALKDNDWVLRVPAAMAGPLRDAGLSRPPS